METIKYDVFLSRKSEDAHLAKEIYDFLTEKGLKVFDSDYSLQEMGNADYSKAIDEALVNTENLIVIGSSVENISSSWVEAEWRFFLNRKRGGKVTGNLFSIISDNIKIDELPPSLQNYQVFQIKPEYLNNFFNYLKKEINTETIEFLKFKALKYYKNNELKKAYELFEMVYEDFNDFEAAFYLGRMLSNSEEKEVQTKALGLLNFAQINGVQGAKEEFEKLYRYIYL